MDEPWMRALALSGVSIIAVLGAWMMKSEAQSDTPPPLPPERPPAEHEVKTALADIRVALERLQSVLERQHDHHEDELRAIQRQLDRIDGRLDSARRLEDVMMALRRQDREA